MVLSKKDCNSIINFFSSLPYVDGANRASIVYKNEILSLKRDVKGRYIDTDNKEFISFITAKLNFIGIKSITLGEVKFTTYTKGDYFAPHRDFIKYNSGNVVKTAVIQLSSPSEYEGGDLIVKGIPQSKELGSISIFNSRDLHEVTKIKKGIRKSLVIFLLSNDLNFSKSIL